MERFTEKLVDFVRMSQLTDLPENVIHEMKRVILDSIGCALNGLSTERGKIAVELARRLGGCPEATVFGTNEKVSCANAAFANGELINALDFDAFSGGHSAPILIPAALALGESVGASGKDIILALALGFEISHRLKTQGRSLITEGPDKGKINWRGVYGHSVVTLAAAACAGKILNLDKGKIANTIGIAGCMCPPNIQAKWMRTAPVRMTKYGPAGWSAHVAVASALLADMGYTGDTDLFEGDYGFWRYTADEEWKKEEVLEDLGIEWLCHQVSYRQYPAGL
jgi:2-methylcitrate dehydratase PrpD